MKLTGVKRLTLKPHSLKSRTGSSSGKRDFRIGLKGGKERQPGRPKWRGKKSSLKNSSKGKMQCRNNKACKKEWSPCAGHISNVLNQNLWVWPSGISIFESCPSDSNMGPSLRPSAWNRDMHALMFRTHPILEFSHLGRSPLFLGRWDCFHFGWGGGTEQQKSSNPLSLSKETQASPLLLLWPQGRTAGPGLLAKSGLAPFPVFLIHFIKRLS